MAISLNAASISYADAIKASTKKGDFPHNMEKNQTPVSRFRRSTMNDLMKLDVISESDPLPVNVIEEEIWTNESLLKISERFNTTIPRDLFMSFKCFFTDRSVILAITDINCSLYRFPKDLLYEELSTNNLWDSILRIADHPNPRYLAIEFYSEEQKNKFDKTIKTLGKYALVKVNQYRENFITGTIKNTYFNYTIIDLNKLMQPFGVIVAFQPIYLKGTPIPIYGNSYHFKVKLNQNVNPNDIPTLITDHEATLLLIIHGLKPQCFHCKQRGHIINACPKLKCKHCDMRATSSHQCGNAPVNNTDFTPQPISESTTICYQNNPINDGVTDDLNITREQSVNDESESILPENQSRNDEDKPVLQENSPSQQELLKSDCQNHKQSKTPLNKTSQDIIDYLVPCLPPTDPKINDTANRKPGRPRSKRRKNAAVPIDLSEDDMPQTLDHKKK